MKPSDKMRRTHSSLLNGLLGMLLFLLLASCATGRSEAQSMPPDAANAVNAPGVIINEILAHTDEPQVDSVEFYNPTATAITMAGWWFSDNDTQLDRMVLPAQAVVPARSYYVLELLEEGPVRLSEMGETVTLTAIGDNGAPTGYSDTATFLASPNGVSLGRVQIEDGAQNPVFFPLQQSLTLGAPNSAPRVGPVVMAEIMYNALNGKPQYIELLNTSSKIVYFYDPVFPANRWQIEGVDSYAIQAESIAPGASLFVAGVSPSIFRAAYNLPESVDVVGPFAGSLKKSGERVALLSPEPPNREDNEVPYVVVDEVNYGTQAPWPAAPNGEGPALARVNLAGYGQEPRNWAASTLPLEAGPAVSTVRSVVLPAPGGGRAIQWTTAQEWRLKGFTIWRGNEGSARADAVQVGGEVLPHNSRHLARNYQLIDGAADAGAAYTYWIEALTQDAGTLALATLSAPPPTLVHLPVVRQ